MNLQSQSESLDAYDTNIDRVVGNIEQADVVMQEVSQLLMEAKTLVSQVGSDTYSQAQRTANGEAINQMISQVVWLANSEVLGQRLFSGNETATVPYVVEETDGMIRSVSYQGGRHSTSTPVAPGVEQPGTLVGEKVFGSYDRQVPQMFGDTGAGVGSGTSTVRGDIWLTATHDTTTFAGATGVAAGSRSASEDTILGTSHTLTIDADNATVQLDSGQSVPYGAGGDDANLAVTNADGDTVYIDVTNLAGGLTGVTNVAITATAKMSIDDMVSTVDVTTFGENEAITDSRTGQILYVDATSLQRVGLEPVHIAGTSNVFDVLIAARDVLLNDRGLSRAQQGELTTGTVLESFDEIITTVIANSTAVGGRLQAMSNLKGSVADIKLSLDTRRSDLQDADIVQLATDLARTQAFYEMVLAASAKVLKVSLLDYV
jgi:flagellar hook-associated protein 3